MDLEQAEANCWKWFKIAGWLIVIGFILFCAGWIVDPIIQSVFFPRHFGVYAKDAIPDLLMRVYQNGYGMELHNYVEFNPGDLIYQRDAIGRTPISTSNVIFICADSVLCGPNSGSALEVTNSSIIANVKVSTTVAVCFNGTDPNYYVVVGSVTTNMRDKAESICGLS